MMPLLLAHDFLLYFIFIIYEACRCFKIRNEFVKGDFLSSFFFSVNLLLIDNILRGINKFYTHDFHKWFNLL